MKKQSDIHSSSQAYTSSGQVVAVGDAARWPDWLELLVTTGYRVEVVPDAERAFVRCVERVIDLVLVAAETAAEDAVTLERLRRLSPCTRMLLIGDGCERGATSRLPSTQAGETVRAISASLSAKAFADEVQVSVRACRMARERRERIDQLRSLVQRCTDDSHASEDFSTFIERLPRKGGSAAPLMGIQSLVQSMSRELDPLHAARETADFINRCLPDAMVAVWLAGVGTQLGLAACSGHADANADIAVRLMSRVERLQLPALMVSGGIITLPSASPWGSADDASELEGHWCMLAACRQDGQCHAAIMILGPRGERPLPAETALESVRTLLGNHLGLIERVNLRATPEWPTAHEAFDHDDGPRED